MTSPTAITNPLTDRDTQLEALCQTILHRKQRPEQQSEQLDYQTSLNIFTKTTPQDLTAAKSHHPELTDITGPELRVAMRKILRRLRDKESDEYEGRMIILSGPHASLWKAIRAYDLRREPPDPRNLLDMLTNPPFPEPVRLGTLHDHPLAFIPNPSALPPTNTPANANTGFSYVLGGKNGVIIYDAGYLVVDQIGIPIPIKKDGPLRRFCCLEWIVISHPPRGYCSRPDKYLWWHRTGHVLVVDLDEGRERQPWIVLAAEWPVEKGEAHKYYRGYKHQAERIVPRDAEWVKDILPGGKERVTVAKLVPGVH